MKVFLELVTMFLVLVLIGGTIVLAMYGVSQLVPTRSMQAIKMNEQTVQIMYTPNKPVYVTCYADDVLLECVNAPSYGQIIYTTTHMATEYTVKVYYEDGSIEEKKITIQVP